MANPSKQKGTRAESHVVRYLQGRGISASRRALHGAKDVGDIIVQRPYRDPIILEVKAGKQTQNPNRNQLTEWLDQAWVEQRNAGMKCLLVVVRYNRRLKDADCWYQWIDEFGYHKEHMWFDELARRIEEGSIEDGL